MTSIATYIRDQALSRIQKANLAQWKSVRKTPFPTLQPDQVTGLGVFILRETMNADGDANVSAPRYISDVVIGISVIDNASSPAVLEGSVDTLIANILDTLLTDPTFVSLKDATGNFLTDSVPLIVRQYSFPTNGETYYLECRLQMTIRYFVNFPPNTPIALTDVMVTPSPQPSNGTAIMDIPLPQ